MKVKHVTPKLPSNFPLGLYTHQFFVIFQILSKFPFPGFHLHSTLTLLKFKSLSKVSPYQNSHEIQNLIISDYFSFKCFKKWPFTLPKIKYKTP